MAIAVAQDPVQTLVNRWGEAVAQARHRTDLLADSLRELEAIAGQLADWGVHVTTELGPIGDAARAAHVTVQEHRLDHERDIFAMP